MEIKRFCCHCREPIDQEKLRKGARVYFCSQVCRTADSNIRKSDKKAALRAKGICPSCRRLMPLNKKEDGNTREYEVV